MAAGAAAQPPAGVPGVLAAPPLAVPLPPDAAVAQAQPPVPQPDPKKVPDLGGDPQPKGTGTEKKTTPEEQAALDRRKYTALPKPEDVLHIYDNAQLEQIIMNSIREADRQRNVKMDGSYEATLKFPPVAPVGGNAPYVAKTATYPPMQTTYDALYVVHRRLHFEEKNAERYGWDLGIVQPLVSSLYFYRDVLMWPQSLASGFAYGFWDTSAGKCLPGTPVPYYLYPPGLTITGTAFEGVIMTGMAFVFP
ncbi:Putative secreted protein OS=Rhodopirellula sallentina SM41 GN=RSSM_03940 PE=4 SV=1 [Gemmataceae bacterium]|nr:Putative secreted protein OS=Rhodopirellula sallentina SM41 GN=RSSM_03940 PE=4 SV=1 [Gemmataceae bacterium]VTU02146.1 Putative secreted protein OS=Rhodopirellula sallentina SM41 GN=RSSM_03940 PE=4 SV=1 [Gemmataceae bacterium]